MNNKKKQIIIVYNNLGMGGITKSLINFLNNIDYFKYEVTLYIRRDDEIALMDQINCNVHTVFVANKIKKREFESDYKGKIANRIFNLLNKHHPYTAKQFLLWYMYPKQRKKEKIELDKDKINYDVAISFSTDGDDPVFVHKCVKASKKYVFLHQSTPISHRNIKAIKHFDAFLSVNPALIPWMQEFTHHAVKVYPFRNYVDYEQVIRLSKLCEDRINTDEKRLVLSTCGRLCKTKGYDYVIDIAVKLKLEKIDFIWYWIGDGPSRDEMERLIKNNHLESQMILVGNKTNPYPYIANCDIYIQPSRAEAYPNTILEALVLQRPLITTRTAGGQFITEYYNCGIIVDNPVSEMPNIIVKLMRKEELEKERKKAQKIDWQEDERNYKFYIESLLSGTFENQFVENSNI